MQNLENPENFYTVDLSSLQNITVEEILSGGGIEPEEMDYTVPVPTTSQSIPHTSRDSWFQVEFGGLDPSTLPQRVPKTRGNLGGC